MAQRMATSSGLVRLTAAMVCVIALFYILAQARDLLYPIALGALLAFLLLPLTSRLEGWGLPRVLANLIAIIIGIGVVYAVVWFIHRQLASMATDLPQLKERMRANVTTLVQGVGGRLGVQVADDSGRTVMQRLGQVFNGDTGKNLLAATSNTLIAVGLIPVYTFMCLYYRDKFHHFLLLTIPSGQRVVARRIITEVSHVTVHYITGIGAVVLILTAINILGFTLIGIERPVLFGLLAAICASIPYFGNIAGYTLVVLVTLVTSNDPGSAGYVALQFVIVQFIENNVLTPNIVGNMVRLSPFFIIVGLLGSTLLWGLPGAFVVVPALAMLKVTLDHLPRYASWAFLLSDRMTEREKPRSKWKQYLRTFLRKDRLTARH